MEQVAFEDTHIEFSTLGELDRETLDRLYRNHTLRGDMTCSLMKENISRERRRRMRHNSYWHLKQEKLLVAILYDSEDRIMGWSLCDTCLTRNMSYSPRLQVFIQRRFRGQLHGGRIAYLFAREIKRRCGVESFCLYNEKIEGSVSKFQDGHVRKDRRLSFRNLNWG
tara:strand:- start:5241 stop:5741 length:501 start_codon:yes stop_codon:yes gene_type:complete